VEQEPIFWHLLSGHITYIFLADMLGYLSTLLFLRKARVCWYFSCEF